MVKQGVQKAAKRTLAELFVCYSNDIVCKVVDVWDDLQYIHAYVVDYTEHEDLAEYNSERCLPGRRNLKVEIHEPHRSYFKQQWECGHVWTKIYKFSNVRTKISKGQGSLEGTMWPDKRDPTRINIRPLLNEEHDVRQLLQRKHEYEHPPKINAKRKRQTEQKKAQKAVDAELAREEQRKRLKIAPDCDDGSRQNSPVMIAMKGPAESNPQAGNQTNGTYALRDASRASMKQTKNHIGSCLSDLTFDNAMKLTQKLLAGTFDLSATIVQHLNEPSTPNAHASLELRPMRFPSTLYLKAREAKDEAESMALLREFGGIARQSLDNPWSLSHTQIPAISFPDGYEAFDAPEPNPRVHVDKALERKDFQYAPASYLSNCANMKSSAQIAHCVVFDHEPPHISQFAQRLTELDVATGEAHHTGDRFSFWLLLYNTKTPDACPFWVWVPNAAAEMLLGMTATQVLEGREDGVARMRARLRELWGCFELCKDTFDVAHRDEDATSTWKAWKEARYEIMGRPVVSLGLRALPVDQSIFAEITTPALDDEVGTAELPSNILYLLEDTHVELGDA